MKWERVQAKNRAIEAPDSLVYVRRGAYGPGKKWGHTCNAVQQSEGQTLMYVFGGFGSSTPNTENSQTNDIHVFDTAEQMWSKPKANGMPPRPRDSHSCSTVGHQLFVFGGSDGRKPLKDLQIFDTRTNCWSSPMTTGHAPSAREGHSAAVVGHHLYLFGGCGRPPRKGLTETVYNDVYILNTITLTWRKAPTRGTPPGPRDGPTCSSFTNKIIVIGGADKSDSTLSDVFILDADTLVWKELRTVGELLTPRSGHTAVALGENVFVFGGYNDDNELLNDLYVLNVESGVWTKEAMIGQVPSHRFACAGDCIGLEKGILLFGGTNVKLEALDDMFFLDTQSDPVMK